MQWLILQQKDELELTILRRAEDVKNQQGLAKELGFSVGKINYVLKALIQKGLIKAENFANSKSKKQYKYMLTPKGIEAKIDLTKKFIEYKKKEYEELQSELEKMKNEEIK